jgi:hypothetical protein
MLYPARQMEYGAARHDYQSYTAAGIGRTRAHGKLKRYEERILVRFLVRIFVAAIR